MTPEAIRIVFLVNLGATLFMAGVIWFVQVVHYPLFARVSGDGFTRFAAGHVRRTTWVVAPVMLLEAATAGVLAWRPPGAEWGEACWAGLALVALIWLSTALLQVPQHQVL